MAVAETNFRAVVHGRQVPGDMRTQPFVPPLFYDPIHFATRLKIGDLHFYDEPALGS